MASKGSTPISPIKAPASPAAKTDAKPAAAALATAKVAAKSAVPAPKVAKSAPAVAKPMAPPVTETVDAPKPVVAATPAAPAPVVTPAVTAPKVAAPAPTVSKKEVTMEATIKNAAEKTQAQATAMFADVNDRAKAAMEKSTKAFEEMNEFNKGNIEALVESGKIAAKGIEAMGQEAAEYSRKQFESATAALKTLSSVKSPTEFFKMQSDFMRQSFDSVVAETSKNTEAMLKLVGEVAQPISNRVAVAAEKVKIAA